VVIVVTVATAVAELAAVAELETERKGTGKK
jgi:hypothetical protein